ncbi:protein O-linked-mannose beta-1,2-N-acetylglucosaminyltransferase 1-like isoform X2 [Penaeus japonicus]|uniref:protein O-linked-mannose beta-1,2-N-acetylglucosaminyltransferase 1-like isoform X2 n=1 Tax=Penaeus japonicus TaxID=27405 RepID=UPI001C712C12|nr:protein O-linked-mannose beta-1,2-N-acetylglucosaminyltransferase 1-like isoform X2 [Penaeus japonicus]
MSESGLRLGSVAKPPPRSSFGAFVCFCFFVLTAAGNPNATYQATMNINVKSSIHQLLLTVDDTTVVNVTSTEEDTKDSAIFSPWVLSSGLYIMVLKPTDGSLKFKRVVMTTMFGLSQEIPSLLLSLAPGNILVLAVKNDAALNLSPTARDLLKSLGVKSAHALRFRNNLAWVGTVGGRTWGEAVTPDIGTKGNYGDLWSSPIHLDLQIPRRPEEPPCFPVDDLREAARASFCDRYEGYGTLCSCENPAPLSYHPPKLEGSTIEDVPLVIVAGNRATYLYRTLVTVLRQPGGHTQRILVYVHGHHQEVADLLDLLQVPFEENLDVGDFKVEGKIAEHYRKSLVAAFSRFPEAPKAILLEEDLLVAPDFFSFFSQTAWLLDHDSTLWCVSAWNDLSSLHVAHDPSQLRRVETLPGLGWMLTRRLAEELLLAWHTKKKNQDWDIWARGPFIIAGRECVVPDVSRTFHIGLSGAHNPGLIHAAFFSAKPMPADSNVKLKDVDRLTFEKYEEDIYRLLQDDPLFLDTKLHPCDEHYLPRNITCLGVWDQDIRAMHRGLFWFYFYETQVMVIGYPYSDYSFHKPPEVEVLRVANQKDIEKLNLVAPSNRYRFRRPELESLAPFMDTSLPNLPP